MIIIYSMVLFSWGEEYIPVEKLTHGLSFNEGGKKLGFQDGDLLVSIDGVRLVEFDNMMLMSSILFEGAKSVLVNRGGEDVLISIDNLLINDIISNLGPSSGPLLSPNFEWIIGEFVKGSVAERAGLKRGDQILAINDLETPFFNSVARDYLRSQAGQTITVVVQRGFGGRVENVPVELGEDGFLGLSPLMDKYFDSREYSFLSSFSGGLNKTINMVNMYWGQMKTIFNPKTGGYKHVGGVISIGKMFPGEWNWLVFWSMTALLSIILAIMNLLPIPALDGGHALIAITEILTGKKLPLRVLMPLQVAGMIVLFALLIYANGMDIVRLFN